MRKSSTKGQYERSVAVKSDICIETRPRKEKSKLRTGKLLLYVFEKKWPILTGMFSSTDLIIQILTTSEGSTVNLITKSQAKALQH